MRNPLNILPGIVRGWDTLEGLALDCLLNMNAVCNKSERLLLQYQALRKALSQGRMNWMVL